MKPTPTALPSLREVALRRRDRLHRRQQQERLQAAQAAVRASERPGLPDNEVLEQASMIVALPVCGRLVPTVVPSPKKAQP
jgi:hypothetical protein